MMSENDDITIILAKANMLIYFSKLFVECSDASELQKMTNDLINNTFKLSKTLLGTLDKVELNTYDLILANPPYYQSKIMTNEAKKTKQYEWGGAGVEGLFLEWIVKSLNYGGVANVVLPDGIFSNIQNKKLKKNIIAQCYIESIISLPINTFFNTPKKTYILTLRKKTKNEIDNNTPQKYPVFTYICKSIGETLDTNRFDEPNNNDLHEAVNKFNNYRKLSDKNNIQEPFKTYFESDKQFKAIPVSEFTDDSWIIENWWSEQEKIDIGLVKAKETFTIEEFQNIIDETVQLMNEFKEELECLK